MASRGAVYKPAWTCRAGRGAGCRVRGLGVWTEQGHKGIRAGFGIKSRGMGGTWDLCSWGGGGVGLIALCLSTEAMAHVVSRDGVREVQGQQHSGARWQSAAGARAVAGAGNGRGSRGSGKGRRREGQARGWGSQ